jgi:hypothetical protein
LIWKVFIDNRNFEKISNKKKIMKVIVSEDQYNSLRIGIDMEKEKKKREEEKRKEEKKKGKEKKEEEQKQERMKWIDDYPCLKKTFPTIEADDVINFAAEFTSGEKRMRFFKDGTFIGFYPNPNFAPRSGSNVRIIYKWWCDSKGKFQFDRITEKQQMDMVQNFQGALQKPINQAKTMDDVRNGEGYIIMNMRGEHVRELQKMLMKLGYDLGSTKDDNYFGQKTKNAVEKFQKDVGIKPKHLIYGVFGKMTYDALFKKLKEKKLI